MVSIRDVVVFLTLVLAVPLTVASPLASSAERIKFGTAIRGNPMFILPPIAAQEKGLWREGGLEAEWIPFVTGAIMHKAILAGELAITITTTGGAVIPASRGVPQIIVADIGGFQPWWLYVREGSFIKEEKEVKGARLAVSRLGSLDHAYSRAIVRGLGLSDKDVKYIATGGVVQTLAVLRAGHAEAVVQVEFSMARLEADGIFRRLISFSRFVPKDWDPLTVTSIPAYVEKSPDVLRRVIRTMLKAGQFILANPEWSIQKIRAEFGHPQPVAEKIYKIMNFSKDGKIYPERIKNVREFMINYDLISAQKAPPLEALYTDKFVPIQ